MYLLKMLGVAALYALFAHISHLYVMSNDNGISAIWPSSGLALAVLLIGGKRYAWSVFIGSLLMANVMEVDTSVWTDIAIALGNTLAALIGAWLLTRNGRFEHGIGSLRDFLRLILLGGCAASIISTVAGNTALLASGFIGSGEYLYSLLRWWMGDVLGVVLITPLILSWWKTKNTHETPTAEVFEIILLLGLTFIVGQVVFLDWSHVSVGYVAKGYWMFLLIVWVAVRLGVRGVAVALFVTAVQGLWGAYHEVGFFEHDIAQTQLVNYWLYMATLSVVGMALATHFAERKLIEEMLRRSETRLRTLYDTTSDAVTLLDEKGFLDCNKATLAMFGCATREEFCSKHLVDLSPPEQPCGTDSKALANRQIATAMEKGRCQFEWAHRRVDSGEAFSAEMMLNRVELDGRTILQATVRDITGRKQAEELTQQFSGLLHGSFNEIYIFDACSLRFLLTSAGAEKNLGYSSDELSQLTPLDLKPSFTRESYERLVAPLRSGELQSLLFEAAHRRKAGTTYPVEVHLQLMQGQSPVFIAIIQDATGRKDNEAKIERLTRTHRLLTRVNEAIVRAQNRDGLFKAICNAAMESELFRFVWIGMLDEQKLSVMPATCAGLDEGYTDKLNIRLDDEFTGNGPTGRAIREGTHVVCHDIEHDPCMAPWRDEALKRGYRASAVFPIREEWCVVGAINVYAADTHFFTSDIIQLMLELAADVSFALGVFVERNRREWAEDEINQLNVALEHRVLERTCQLEAANKELEAFSYSVSHDLRAPLRSIDGFSQILLKTHSDRLDATGQDYLQRVRRASQRMGHLIDDLLQLSQVARSSIRREPVDLSEIAEFVADDLRKTNPERQVQFDLQQGISMQADPGLLRIVMENLLGNAYKFTGKKAEAKIEFGKHDIDGESVFFVRDNGDGFNMDYVHKLFGAFQRLHGAGEFEGTGIGLATVQRIIHRHNGRIWAEGKEGQGATFCFTLPQREGSMRRRNED